MTVYANKPAFNVREKLKELEKPSGIAGRAMLAADTPQEQFNLISAGRKNVFINGNFSVAQRGAGPTTGITGYPTVDRWLIPLSEQTTQQLSNDRVSTPSKMLKVTATTNGYGIIRQIVEDVSTLSGGYATLSFWAKTSTANAFRVEFQQLFGTGGSGTVSIIDDADYWKVPNAEWNFYSITVYLPSTLGKTVGTGSPGLGVLFGPTSGQPNSNIVYYSEVQLEAGKIATPFEHRSYGEELALCQRYFYAFQSPNDPLGENGFMGTAYAADNLYCPIFLPVQMRAIPGIISGGQWWIRRGNNFAFTGAFGQQRGGRNTMIIAQSVPSGSGINVTDAVWVEPDNTAYLYFQAEL
jgi:hypothetical protein